MVFTQICYGWCSPNRTPSVCFSVNTQQMHHRYFNSSQTSFPTILRPFEPPLSQLMIFECSKTNNTRHVLCLSGAQLQSLPREWFHRYRGVCATSLHVSPILCSNNPDIFLRLFSTGYCFVIFGSDSDSGSILNSHFNFEFQGTHKNSKYERALDLIFCSGRPRITIKSRPFILLFDSQRFVKPVVLEVMDPNGFVDSVFIHILHPSVRKWLIRRCSIFFLHGSCYVLLNYSSTAHLSQSMKIKGSPMRFFDQCYDDRFSRLNISIPIA